MDSMDDAVWRTTGGSFLIAASTADDVFCPEDFTHENEAVAQTSGEFYESEVAPVFERITAETPARAARVLRKSAELGLTAVIIPERYGGMELDLISAMIVTDRLSRDASYSLWHVAHAGTGTIPLLLHGTGEQKERYLTRLSSGEMIGAFALSEESAASDAFSITTEARRDDDGYILMGRKSWIANAGNADLFTVLAKVDGERMTAFLVERAAEGVQIEEQELIGLDGGSMASVSFHGVRVPVNNRLGAEGEGGEIALPAIDAGRLMMAMSGASQSRRVFEISLSRATEREVRGQKLAEFGLVRQKLAAMATATFAVESVAYRVAGLIRGRIPDAVWQQADGAEQFADALDEFAPECALAKIFATDSLQRIADEAVQIYGASGCTLEAETGRAYCDARVLRFAYGTNEVNRLAAMKLLIRRSQQGHLDLPAAVKAVRGECLRPQPEIPSEPVEEALHLAGNARRVTLLALGAAFGKYTIGLDRQQEILAGLADLALVTFALESSALRAQKLEVAGRAMPAAAMCRLLAHESMDAAESIGRGLLAASSEGDELRDNLTMLRRLTRYTPVDRFAAGREVAGHFLESGKYRL